MKPKLTPTTNDLLKEAALNGSRMSAQVVVSNQSPAHVPLPPPVIFPPNSVPAPKKKGRPKKATKIKLPHIPLISEPPPPAPEKKPLKIACIGTAPSSRMLAPYKDPDWTIWACSPGNMDTIPRFDAWFEVHGTALLWPEDAHYAPKYIEWMKNLKCPLYMQDQQIVQHAQRLPIEMLVDIFGPFHFTSTFSYMMAMAILAGAEEVALFGIDMASRGEYETQRSGAYYFMLEGAKRGVKVWAPFESDIMQAPPLYGYSEVGPYGRKLAAREKELKDRIGPMEAQFNALRDNLNYLKGALEDIDYQRSIQGGAQSNPNGPAYLNKIYQEAKIKQQSAAVPLPLTLHSQG